MPPTIRQRLMAVVVVTVAIAFIYSIFSRAMIPTPTVVRVGLVGGAFTAALGFLWAWRLVLPPRRDWRRSKFFRAPVLALLGFAAGFNVFAIAIPSLYTLAAGTPAERHTVVSGWHYRSRRSCAGPEIPEANTFTTHLCWSQRLANGTALDLHGEESALGFEVENLAPVP